MLCELYDFVNSTSTDLFWFNVWFFGRTKLLIYYGKIGKTNKHEKYAISWVCFSIRIFTRSINTNTNYFTCKCAQWNQFSYPFSVQKVLRFSTMLRRRNLQSQQELWARYYICQFYFVYLSLLRRFDLSYNHLISSQLSNAWMMRIASSQTQISTTVILDSARLCVPIMVNVFTDSSALLLDNVNVRNILFENSTEIK